MSRRERLAEARRRRLAELARLAAIARQRAADQALRDEAAANIARDNVIGEDPEIRRIAIAALGNHAGTVVVMDPKTGRVYTVVNQEWAIRRGFKPCSTIKLVTGIAGLCEKVIDPVQMLRVGGGYEIDLTDSLAFSNNPYFQEVGGRVGFDKIISYARQLGLGERTGINYPNEYPGRVPLFKTGYDVNHMCSHGDDFEVTPIQLATLVSAIANGGTLLVPHLPRTPEENAQFKTEKRRQLDIPQEVLQRMTPGMVGAVNYGTAKLAYDPAQTIAGKTGTCTGQGAKLGLFTSYAPVHDPRLAVVVVTRGSGERGRIAAGIAGYIYRALGYRFSRAEDRQVIATTPPAPRPKVDPATAAANGEDADGDDDEAATTDAPGAADKPNATHTGVKEVLMPVEKKPAGTTPTAVTPEAATPPAAAPTATPQIQIRPRRATPEKP
jgi:cell division protein FtsI/penicillin-binding protein 2